jgi:hypothetical protein
MAFANSGDPSINPKEGGFEDFEAGVYTIYGIEDYFSKDESELPVFKVVQNELKAHCHFTTNGTQFPAWSGTKDEYVRLAKALGAKVDDLQVEATTEFLLQIQKRINAAHAETEVYVGTNGWVKKINALLPLTGFYRVTFKDAFSLDKTVPVKFQDQTSTFNGKEITQGVVWFQFEIISDVEDGTDHAGDTFLVRVFDPFDGVFNNNPAWKHAKNGGMLNGQRRLMAFLNIFWPDVEDYTWEVNPQRSDYGVNEAENPLAVIVAKAKESGRQAMTRIETNEKGFVKMELMDLAPCKSSVPTTAKPAATTKKVHMNIIKTINEHAFPVIGENALISSTDDPYAFSAKGLGWCKENVAPIWDVIELPKTETGKRDFSILTSEQAAKLVNALDKKFGTADF